MMENRIVAKRGFVTIATGAQKYYQMAFDLLNSYRANGNSSLPFALICDRDCEESRAFDHVVMISQPHHSYMDKLQLYQYTPFEETIFIDADALFLREADILWEDFSPMDDFSCYGRTLPLESRHGWFYYQDMGDLKDQLSFGISMHGGLYYLRKTERCKQVFDAALDAVEHFDQYTFTGFTKPADEPVLALAMVLKECKPCNRMDRIVFFPIHEGKLKITAKGQLLLNKFPIQPVIFHVGNWHLGRYIFQFLRKQVYQRRAGKDGSLNLMQRIKLRLRCLPVDADRFIRRVARTYLPTNLIRQIKAGMHKK